MIRFDKRMKTKLFNYHLPKELIAQSPATPRDHSRLLVYERKTEKIIHDKFFNLKKYLQPNDVLVFNNTKVFPARLILKKNTGGKVEILLLKDLGQGKWECLLGGRRIKENLELSPARLRPSDHQGPPVLLDYGGQASSFLPEKHNQIKCKVLNKLKGGRWIVRFNLAGKELEKFLNQHGQTPTPPYIKKKSRLDKYQTIYARYTGSVAAPTAGLHFTKKLLKELNKFGVQQEFITLHVGLGTFAPVKTKEIEDHHIHAEFASLDKQTCQRLNKAKEQGKKVIAVGTTSVRVLETASDANGKLKPLNGWINLFIYPGYKFKFVDGIITNFHLPKSTLLMLVAAFVDQEKNFANSPNKNYGTQKILEVYKEAIKKNYRFYSFGDAMLVL